MGVFFTWYHYEISFMTSTNEAVGLTSVVVEGPSQLTDGPRSTTLRAVLGGYIVRKNLILKTDKTLGAPAASSRAWTRSTSARGSSVFKKP